MTITFVLDPTTIATETTTTTGAPTPGPAGNFNQPLDIISS